MDAWQVRLIKANVLIVLEVISQAAAVFDLGEEALDIDAVIGGTAGRQEVKGGGEEITGAEDVTLLQMIASSGELHEPMKEFGILPGFVGDQLFEVVMALQKGATVEELDPPL